MAALQADYKLNNRLLEASRCVEKPEQQGRRGARRELEGARAQRATSLGAAVMGVNKRAVWCA